MATETPVDSYLRMAPHARPPKGRDDLFCDIQFIKAELEAMAHLLQEEDLDPLMAVGRRTWIGLGNFFYDTMNLTANERKEHTEHAEGECPGPGVCEHGKSRAHRITEANQ